MNAAEPLEESLKMLEILKPIIIAVITLLIVVISLFIILGRRTEIAILRVLGKTRKQIRLFVILNQLILCVAGLIVGAIIVMSIQSLIMVNIAVPILTTTGLSLIASFIGAFGATIILTNRAPLALIQDKE